MLHIHDLVYRIGGRVLFEGATTHIPAGARVGLVGRNGTGKSTLFKLILGELSADGGTLSLRPSARLGSVAQDVPSGAASLLDTVLAADMERSTLLAEADTATDPTRIADIHERLNAIAAHAAPARAATILSGLGFSPEQQQRPVSDFSGGWRMRVALASTLFVQPDMLLLDEPTNHLDLEANLWLESYLANYPGTLIIISHDRDLLNTCCTRIIHLHQGKLDMYQGNYQTFERTRREKMLLDSKMAEKQADHRAKLQAFVDRFRAKASKAKQAQSRLKVLEKMEPIVPVVEDRTITLDFPNPEPLSPPIITIDDGQAGYDATPILSRINLRLDMDDRIGMLGANGQGKSTLAKVLSGRMPLQAGTLRKSDKLKVGFFAQHQLEDLNPDQTPYQHFEPRMQLAAEPQIRAHLGRFGFDKTRADTKIKNLSGGEKARLAIALMCHDHPHVMILDEPTNHLDIDTRDALTEALNSFEGAVIIISHDPHLVDLTCDRFWLVDGGTVQPFDGDMAAYRKFLLDKAKQAKAQDKAMAGTASTDTGKNKKDERRQAAAQRQHLAPLKKKVDQAIKAIEAHTAAKARIEEKLADPTLYDGPTERVTALQKALAEAEETLAAAELDWMDAEDTYEAEKNRLEADD
jgi:ATP-binding cassette subfamily F protein 3